MNLVTSATMHTEDENPVMGYYNSIARSNRDLINNQTDEKNSVAASNVPEFLYGIRPCMF